MKLVSLTLLRGEAREDDILHVRTINATLAIAILFILNMFLCTVDGKMLLAIILAILDDSSLANQSER